MAADKKGLNENFPSASFKSFFLTVFPQWAIA